jgi:hypothetical protein
MQSQDKNSKEYQSESEKFKKLGFSINYNTYFKTYVESCSMGVWWMSLISP